MHNIYQHGRYSTHIIVSCTVEFFVPLFKMIKTQNNHPKQSKTTCTKVYTAKALKATCRLRLPPVIHGKDANHSCYKKRASQPPSKFSSTTS